MDKNDRRRVEALEKDGPTQDALFDGIRKRLAVAKAQKQILDKEVSSLTAEIQSLEEMLAGMGQMDLFDPETLEALYGHDA